MYCLCAGVSLLTNVFVTTTINQERVDFTSRHIAIPLCIIIESNNMCNNSHDDTRRKLYYFLFSLRCKRKPISPGKKEGDGRKDLERSNVGSLRPVTERVRSRERDSERELLIFFVSNHLHFFKLLCNHSFKLPMHRSQYGIT